MARSNKGLSKCGLIRGDKIIIVDSRYSDIVPGTVGVICKRMPRGYAVDVTCLFSDAIGKRRRLEQRCMFFSTKELRRVVDVSSQRPSTSTPKSEVRHN